MRTDDERWIETPSYDLISRTRTTLAGLTGWTKRGNLPSTKIQGTESRKSNSKKDEILNTTGFRPLFPRKRVSHSWLSGEVSALIISGNLAERTASEGQTMDEHGGHMGNWEYETLRCSTATKVT